MSSSWIRRRSVSYTHLISGEHPKTRLGKPLPSETSSRLLDKCTADAEPAPVWIDVKRDQLPDRLLVAVPGRPDRGEPADLTPLNSEDGHGIRRLGVRERVPLRPFLGLEGVKVVVEQQPPICRLPGAHVHSSYRHRVGRPRYSQEHALSITAVDDEDQQPRPETRRLGLRGRRG